MAKNIIQKLIDAGVIAHKDVEQYMDDYNKNKKQKRLVWQKVELITQEQENQVEKYSQIEKGVLVKADERDVDKNGNYTVPENVIRIREYAFSDCKNVTTVTLGSNVKTINPHAFFDCGVRYINLARVEYIGENAFDFCNNLTEITLSSELKHVGRSAFYNCMSLKKFITPTGVINLQGCKFAFRSDAQEEIEAYIQGNKELAK